MFDHLGISKWNFCIFPYRLGWSWCYKSHLVLAPEFISKLHLSSLKILLPWGNLFLSPPPSRPCITATPPPLLVICLLWEGWAWEWKQDINRNSFQKHKQGCWKTQLPLYTAPLADHNHSLNQWIHAWTGFQTGRNLSLPVTENLCQSDLSRAYSVNVAGWQLIKHDTGPRAALVQLS